MPHFIGWTIFSCDHQTAISAPLEQLEDHYRAEYLNFYVAKDGKSYQAHAPRPCPSCRMLVMQKEQAQAQSPGHYENFEERWRTEWGPKIASLENGEPELSASPLKDLLHHICPHLRSVYNLKEERLLRRVNSQLRLEGLDITENTRPAEVDQETRQRVTRVVEDQLQMHRSSTLKQRGVMRESLLQEAEVAKRSSQSPRLVQLHSKRGALV